jgi:integrase
MAEHLTDKTIQTRRVDTGKTVQIRDDEQPGLAVRIRVNKKGQRFETFVFDRDQNGHRFYQKLGPFIAGSYGIKEAREAAKIKNRGLGENDAEGTLRDTNNDTIDAAWLTYRARLHARIGDAKLRPRTLEGYDCSARHFLRSLGWLKVSRLSVDHCRDLHDALTAEAGARPANASLDLLSRIFRDWRVRTRSRLPDPADAKDAVHRHEIKKRKFKLIDEELVRLMTAIEADPLKDLWLLLIYTAVRRNNALQAHRDQFDLEAKTWTIPKGEAKAGKEIVIQLVDEVVEIVKARGDGYLFPGRWGRGHLVNIKKPWDRVRQAAGLPHYMVHTLRKLHATLGNSAGLTQGQTADLLGHGSLDSQSAYSFTPAVDVLDGQKKIAKRIGSYRQN